MNYLMSNPLQGKVMVRASTYALLLSLISYRPSHTQTTSLRNVASTISLLKKIIYYIIMYPKTTLLRFFIFELSENGIVLCDACFNDSKLHVEDSFTLLCVASMPSFLTAV